MVWLPLVKTQMSPAILRDFSTMLPASSSVFFQQGDGGGLGEVAAAADAIEIVLAAPRHRCR